MRNPYSTSSFRRHKRRAPWHFVWAVLRYLPHYLIYLLSLVGALFSGPRFNRVRYLLLALLKPFWVPVEVIRAWCMTRNWKKLLFASPLLIMVLGLLSVVYINKNSRKEDIHKLQLRRANIALQEGDLAQASMIFGRLIRQTHYRDDPAVLYRAMVVAAQTGNQSRYLTLEKRLVEEFNYPPARRWLAQKVLSGGGDQSRKINEAIEHLDAVLEAAVTDQEKDGVLNQMALLYNGAGRHDQARQFFERVGELSPQSTLKLAEIYIALDNNYKAESLARELLVRLKIDDPQGLEFMNERVSAYVILATVSSATSERMDILQRAYNLLEKRAKFLAEDDQNRAKIAAAYFQLSRLYLSLGDDAAVVRGMICLSDSINTGVAPREAGWILLYSCDPAGNYPVSEQSIQAMLLQGQAAVICHLRLGLDAWRMNKTSLAIFHFKLAQNHDPLSLDLVRNVALFLAQTNEESIVKSVRFTLKNNAPWVTALELLKVISDVEGTASAETLLVRCSILAARERWAEIPYILEPHLKSFSPKNKAQAYYLLSSVYTQTYEYAKAREYRTLYEEAQKELAP